MFDIFSSSPKPVLHSLSPAKSTTPLQPLNDHISQTSSSSFDYDVDETVLKPPAITHACASRRFTRSGDSDLATSETYTCSRGLAQAKPSWILSPLITRFSGRSSPTDSENPDYSSPSRSRRPPSSLDISPNDSQPSPSKETWRPIFKFPGEQAERTNKGETRGTLANWFQGQSDPISIGVLLPPTKVTMNSSASMSEPFSNRPSSLQRHSTSQIPSRPPLSSRFSIFSSKSSVETPSHQTHDQCDELLDLNINKALFPAGSVDPFSPAAFKNLVQNAEGLLTRLQVAYKERMISLGEMTAEKETLNEELEGSQIRANHLKIQLDDMAAKLTEQDVLMMDLVDQLAHEKQLRREEEDAQERGVIPSSSSPNDEGILNVEEYKRNSEPSLISDSGCDSSEESGIDSMDTKPWETTSPNTSLSSFSANSPDGYIRPKMTAIPPVTRLPARIPPRLSTFQNVTKGPQRMSHSNDPFSSPVENVRSSCSSCQGLKPSQAWGMVKSLKDENAGLKAKVDQLTRDVDGCLEAVKGIC